MQAAPGEALISHRRTRVRFPAPPPTNQQVSAQIADTCSRSAASNWMVADTPRDARWPLRGAPSGMGRPAAWPELSCLRWA